MEKEPHAKYREAKSGFVTSSLF